MKKLAGLDWGSAKHAACVIDEQGQVVAQLDVEHTADGLKGLLRELARFAIPEQLPIAIERPSGLLVDTLLDAGHPVVPIHPNALQACRPRYRAAGGKSDPGDAFSLADVLRTDGHRFRPLRPVSDEVKALRALVRSRDDLVAERVALANQLRALLDSFWPGAGAIFSDIDSPIALDFLARYPTPTRARSSVRSAWLGSWRATATPDAVAPRSFSRVFAQHPRALQDRSSRRPRARLSSTSSASSGPSSSASAGSPPRSSTPSPSSPPARS